MKFPAIDLSDFVGYCFAAAVTVSCVRHLAGGGMKRDFEIFKGRKAWDWLEIGIGNLLAIGFLLLVATFSTHFPAILQASWLSLLEKPGAAHQPTNLMVSGARIPAFGLLFVPLLFLNLPRLAAAEEDSFRAGTKNWMHALPRSLSFGLMHMVVGVPLWLGLSLAVPGLWFTKQYFKGGVSRSTLAHCLYNMALASLMFIYLLQLNFGFVKA